MNDTNPWKHDMAAWLIQRGICPGRKEQDVNKNNLKYELLMMRSVLAGYTQTTRRKEIP